MLLTLLVIPVSIVIAVAEVAVTFQPDVLTPELVSVKMTTGRAFPIAVSNVIVTLEAEFPAKQVGEDKLTALLIDVLVICGVPLW